MYINKCLLKLKDITPIQKLILGLILDETPIVLQFQGGYSNTCGEIAKGIGSTRKIVLGEFDKLLELGYITTKKGRASRLTNVTQKLIAKLN